ncbi:MAG: TrmH family RNA methyltransferase [bacterium]|nr:TrmH family RNA methyltransferase [bacterium]
MLISSLHNLKIKEITKLHEKKYRDKTNTFLIEGKHLVLEAYKLGLLKELIIEKEEILPLNVDTLFVTKDILRKISQTNSPSTIMGVAYKKKEESLGERILILDDIQDPGNLGTIIRSAVAFGIDTIVISPNTVDLYNDKVIRSTQGMIFHINIIVRELKPFIEYLRQECYKIVGTNVRSGTDVKDAKIYSHYALIVGNEGQGIKDEISNLCDETIIIKMARGCESLNVAVATSIILYEVST